MTDTMGDTEGIGLILYSGSRDELQAKLRARDDEITALRSQLKDMAEALINAQLQIEYLHDKFKETGTGNAVIAQIEAALKKAGVE